MPELTDPCRCGHPWGPHTAGAPHDCTECPCKAFDPASSDMVNHPPHYSSHPSGVEAIAICEHFPFSVGNAIKYLWRAGLKGDAVEDLEKARWYVDREIERLRNAANLRAEQQRRAT